MTTSVSFGAGRRQRPETPEIVLDLNAMCKPGTGILFSDKVDQIMDSLYQQFSDEIASIWPGSSRRSHMNYNILHVRPNESAGDDLADRLGRAAKRAVRR